VQPGEVQPAALAEPEDLHVLHVFELLDAIRRRCDHFRSGSDDQRDRISDMAIAASPGTRPPAPVAAYVRAVDRVVARAGPGADLGRRPAAGAIVGSPSRPRSRAILGPSG
jgi:hypothetical protein